ncbi:MAG: xylose isomerase [Bacteroidetes bacterium MedPE-SWsnd-G1]|nr:MAG: xylose isomerase [Bacteroidetes bacterium MedPE-SWsnd-G1]
MNRRDFISKSSQTGLALSLLGMYACKNGEKKTIEVPFFKLSLAQWSLHKAIRDAKTLSAFDFAIKAKELGFEGLEYVNQLYEIDKNNKLASVRNLTKELKLRSDDTGMTNVMIMIDHEGDLSVSDKVGRDKAIQDHIVWVDAAAELGCSSIRVNLFGDPGEKDVQAWHHGSVDGMGRLSEYASKSNINVIVENHGGLSSHGGYVAKVLKEINMPNCGSLPDFGNFCVRQESGERWGENCIEQYDVYQGVADLLPYAKGISAKTFDFDKEGNEVTFDYVRLMQMIKDSGFNGFIGVEYEGNNLSEEAGILATKELLLKVKKVLT